MSPHFRARRPPGFRIAAVAAIAAIHGAALVGLSQVRAQRQEEPQAAPVQLALIVPEVTAPTPQVAAVRLADVRPAELVLPQIDIPVEVASPAPPTPAAIGVTPPATPAAAAALAPEAGSDEPVKIETADYVRPCTLRYPPMARRMNAQGTTLVRVLVDTEGRPQDVRVDRSSGYRLLDDAAVECAHQALFKPRREGGRLRASLVVIPFDFFTGVRTASR
jgi:protein TonB